MGRLFHWNLILDGFDTRDEGIASSGRSVPKGEN